MKFCTDKEFTLAGRCIHETYRNDQSINRTKAFLSLSVLVNVAPSGTASQSSSDAGSSSPQVAIDKKPVSCIQTSVETAPWWRVDLGAGYRITAVGVTNRDTNPEWLDNAEICISDTLDALCQTR